jgi:glucose-1-phosphate cytidylyltransferase
MKVVVLCGGLGSRLREETDFRPKPMVEIGVPATLARAGGK